MTVACIHQPDFAPWLGSFDRLHASDVFNVHYEFYTAWFSYLGRRYVLSIHPDD